MVSRVPSEGLRGRPGWGPTTMAAITSVSFRRNVQVKEFETIHVEAQVSVGEDEDPKAALEMARDFVVTSLIAERRRILQIKGLGLPRKGADDGEG